MSKHVNNPFPKGHVPWNKGKRGVYSEEVLKAWSLKRKGVRASAETRKKQSIMRRGEKHPLWGKPRSEETKEKLRKANTRDAIHSDSFIKMVSERLGGKTVKRCTKCKVEKEFKKFSKDLRHYFGLQSQCRWCMKEKRKDWKAANPEYARIRNQARRKDPKWTALKAEYDAKYRNKPHVVVSLRQQLLKRKYGMTLEEYKNLLESQKGVCAICKSDKNSKSCVGGLKSLVVDHCHKSGKVRGLLCDRCNRAIGLLRDDIKILVQAARYIKRNSI